MNKNWPAISKIDDTHLMWAIALLDLNTELGRRLVEQLPEYFTSEDGAGPVPLSVMRQEAERRGRARNPDKNYSYDKLIVHYGGVPPHIPLQTFDVYGNGLVDGGFKPDKLPSEISPTAQQGDLVTWGGKQFVVLEHSAALEEMVIAPAELVIID